MDATPSTYIVFEMMPWTAGTVPVEMLAEFTRVTVGKTEWELSHHTPSFFRRKRLGVMSLEIESGRKPSITRMISNASRIRLPGTLAGGWCHHPIPMLASGVDDGFNMFLQQVAVAG